MKTNLKIKTLLIIIFCLVLTGCGDKAEDAAAPESVNTTETAESTSAEENAAENTPAINQETYKRLAELNLIYRNKKAYLLGVCDYYENIVISQSIQGFDNKNPMDDILNTNKNTGETEIMPANYPNEYGAVFQEETDIPEIDDSELESRIAELEKENEELKTQTSQLSEMITIYKNQCGLQ